VYVNLAYVLNRNGSNLGLNGFGTDVVPGKNQFGTQVGIRHKF
jgi:predicted porin